MDYQIKTSKPWSYRHPKQGRQVLAPGTHRIPEDISDDLARLAIEQGMARRIDRAAAADSGAAKAAKFPRRKPLRSPQNRSLGAAPDNKQPLQ